MSLADNYVIASQLQKSVAGKTITHTIANQNPHSFVWFATKPQYGFNPPDVSAAQAMLYDGLLTGQTIKYVDARAGSYGTYVYLHIGSHILLSNLPTRLYVPSEKLPKRHQLLLTLEDGISIGMCGSLGGVLFLFRANANGDAADYLPSGMPTPLSDTFTEAFYLDFIAKLDMTKLKPAKTVKCLLATNNRFPGLDNTILHEILWEARVHPKSIAAALGTEEHKQIYSAIRTVFAAIITAGGRDVDKDLYGNFGGYQTKVSKNTLDTPCPRCGTPITKEAYLGGVIYFCPDCQPILK